ncbi:MAG TPA: DsbA family protein [archaeon]|nr:DsbA family protein [archaeon]
MKGILIIFALLAVVFVAGCSTTGYVVKARGLNVAGSDNATVTILEYSDFQCPFCGQAEPTIKQILDKYPNDVRVIYKHFPLSQIHPYSEKAAEAAECAADQGKFWEMHDIMFANQNNLYTNSLKQYAKDIGLNTDDFNSCLDSGAMKPRVDNDLRDGGEAGVRGTPAFFVNGRLISGAQPFSVFDGAVKNALG